MPAPFTQLSGSATPTRRYGSFAGRIPVVEVPEAAPPIWIRTDRRMGRFAEPVPAVRYLEPVVIELPRLWDITANDYVISGEPIDIRVESAPIIVAALEWCQVSAGLGYVGMGFPAVGRTSDRISAWELVTLEVRPYIQVSDIFLWGPTRQEILEAERLLGISIVD